MTINSLTSVSLDPMLVLVCVELDARFHDAVLEAGRWGVSILAAEDRGVSTWFATRGRPLHDQSHGGHHRGEPTGVVLLDRALTTLQCVTTAVYPGGDHSIVVGEVVAMTVPPQAVVPPCSTTAAATTRSISPAPLLADARPPRRWSRAG